MKALVLSGLESKNDIYAKVKDILEVEIGNQSYEMDWIDLTEKEIEYCNGCSHCSNIKPGLCAKNDDMQEIFPLMANSEFLIFLSPISFGGFNSELKKAVDRYSALGLPTYTIHRGELHHPPRYENPELFMSIGILEKENEKFQETFKLVSSRIAISCFAEREATVLLKKEQNHDSILTELKRGLLEMGLIS